MVGDAAGHCLPLTGEGIRPAVFFAQRLSARLNDELEGRANRDATRAAYASLQRAYARRYRWLRRLQLIMRGWPDPPLGILLRAFAGGFMFRRVSDSYWNLAAPILPGVTVTTPARTEVPA
jgi:flavin-dependent dehydrogenase